MPTHLPQNYGMDPRFQWGEVVIWIAFCLVVAFALWCGLRA